MGTRATRRGKWIIVYQKGDESPREAGAGRSVGEVNPSSKCAEGGKSGIIQDTNMLNRRREVLPRGEPEGSNAENSA